MGTRTLPRSFFPSLAASRPRSAPLARSLGLLSGSSNYRGETSDRQIVEGRRERGREGERKADDFFVVGSSGGGGGLRSDDVAGGSEGSASREQVS